MFETMIITGLLFEITSILSKETTTSRGPLANKKNIPYFIAAGGVLFGLTLGEILMTKGDIALGIFIGIGFFQLIIIGLLSFLMERKLTPLQLITFQGLVFYLLYLKLPAETAQLWTNFFLYSTPIIVASLIPAIWKIKGYRILSQFWFFFLAMFFSFTFLVPLMSIPDKEISPLIAFIVGSLMFSIGATFFFAIKYLLITFSFLLNPETSQRQTYISRLEKNTPKQEYNLKTIGYMVLIGTILTAPFLTNYIDIDTAITIVLGLIFSLPSFSSDSNTSVQS